MLIVQRPRASLTCIVTGCEPHVEAVIIADLKFCNENGVFVIIPGFFQPWHRPESWRVLFDTIPLCQRGKKSTQQSYLFKEVGPTSLAVVKNSDYTIVGAVECISYYACRCVFTEGDLPNLNLQIPIFPFCVGTEQLSEFWTLIDLEMGQTTAALYGWILDPGF